MPHSLCPTVPPLCPYAHFVSQCPTPSVTMPFFSVTCHMSLLQYLSFIEIYYLLTYLLTYRYLAHDFIAILILHWDILLTYLLLFTAWFYSNTYPSLRNITYLLTYLLWLAAWFYCNTYPSLSILLTYYILWQHTKNNDLILLLLRLLQHPSNIMAVPNI